MKMDIMNPNAAGIDIGSRSHFVAIGQSDSDVREFGVFAHDNTSLANWLQDNNIKTVALESTGTYWQNLYLVVDVNPNTHDRRIASMQKQVQLSC